MTYPLPHSPLFTARLIAQHALWQHDVGSLLNPTIISTLTPWHPCLIPSPHPSSSPTLLTPRSLATRQGHPDSPLRIHDLATGTAFWALSLVQSLSGPSSNPTPDVSIIASDISLTQTPHQATLPRGMELREWNIHDGAGIPAEWRSIYGVLHLRLALLVIRSGDAAPVVQRAWEMLRSGGWIQWGELDAEGAGIIGADAGGFHSEDLMGFQRIQEKTNMEELGWARKLADTFRHMGSDEVGKEVFEGQRSVARFLQTLQFLVTQEEVEERVKSGRKDDENLAKDPELGLKMTQNGVARVVPKVVNWGPKPLAEPRERVDESGSFSDDGVGV